MKTNDIAEMLRACGVPDSRAVKWYFSLDSACEKYQINTHARRASFVAQILHESGRLAYVKELWGPTPAQAKYEGRADLGNIEQGDGFRFRGRGLIQITGRANYKSTGDALGLDLIGFPELLEAPINAAISAAWFWGRHGLNELADSGDFVRITRRINGGINGMKERELFHKLCLSIK